MTEVKERLDEMQKEFNITAEDMFKYMTIFDHIDLDGSGDIEVDELRHGLEVVCHCPPEEVLDDVVRVVDQDESGSIDEAEFVHFMMILKQCDHMDSLGDFLVRSGILDKLSPSNSPTRDLEIPGIIPPILEPNHNARKDSEVFITPIKPHFTKKKVVPVDGKNTAATTHAGASKPEIPRQGTGDITPIPSTVSPDDLRRNPPNTSFRSLVSVQLPPIYAESIVGLEIAETTMNNQMVMDKEVLKSPSRKSRSRKTNDTGVEP